MNVEGRRIRVTGTVQGVGFRPFVYRLATDLGVTGSVWNDDRGAVIEAFAGPKVLEEFLSTLVSGAPAAARVSDLRWDALEAPAAQRFAIADSEPGDEVRVSIPADLPTCPECLREIFDRSNRRYRYPFTNCTGCGPRYTIVASLPYDRPATSMAAFPMCSQCEKEYSSPGDRRFHAQPNACPRCGPRLWLQSPSGSTIEADDPIQAASEALRSGRIVALKGLGGFHLACDASSKPAVQRLRERKRRDEKPFAVMVKDLGNARKFAKVSDAEERVLCGVERPIVLLERRAQAALADNVAPGLSRIGLMLPYTPLHHLLLESVRRPLVMTSGNLSEEPIAISNQEAVARLGSVADLFLVHNREIVARCDDSVSRIIAGKAAVLRRSRGFVARGVRMPLRVARPILACGAHLKNTFCLASGDTAYFSAHIGDLENLETLAALEESIDRMQRLLAIRPQVVAHDLHPEYLSTHYARSRQGVIRVAVQHHHAHVVSAAAAKGLTGPVLGLAYDGTGLGTDGDLWGGELLWATPGGFERLATFRPIPLAGGDLAMREVWRTALALLDDAFDGQPPLHALRAFADLGESQVVIVRRMIQSGLNAPRSHGVGRYFDVFAAIALGQARAGYEGQLAMTLEQAADDLELGHYDFQIQASAVPWLVDLRPAVREAVADAAAKASPGTISAKFHRTLALASAELIRLGIQARGPLPVVLSGGCFQNARLSEELLREVGASAEVHLPDEVPAGDGGLALGQVLIADAAARRPQGTGE